MNKVLLIFLSLLLIPCKTSAAEMIAENMVLYDEGDGREAGVEEEYQHIRPPVGFKSKVLPECDASVSVTDVPSKDGAKVWKEHTIILCERPIDFKRIEWGIMLKSQKLAHGDMWIKYEERDKWGVISYRMPQATKEDTELLNNEGPEAFQQRIDATSEDLPLIITLIPEDIRETFILAFIAYRNGAYEIFVFDSKKDVAEMVAYVINAEVRKYKQQLK